MCNSVRSHQSVRSLCSIEHNLLCVPHTRHHWDDRTSCAEAPPSLWNALPLTLTAMTTATFEAKLDLPIFKNFLGPCEQQTLEQHYINVLIMIMQVPHLPLFLYNYLLSSPSSNHT